jgi:hypothetical protein
MADSAAEFLERWRCSCIPGHDAKSVVLAMGRPSSATRAALRRSILFAGCEEARARRQCGDGRHGEREIGE